MVRTAAFKRFSARSESCQPSDKYFLMFFQGVINRGDARILSADRMPDTAAQREVYYAGVTCIICTGGISGGPFVVFQTRRGE